MICAILTLLGVIVLVWLLFSWGVMRFMAIVGCSEYPESPDDIIEDVPEEVVRCPRCGHACPICFGDEGPPTVLQCNECARVGPSSEESGMGFHND